MHSNAAATQHNTSSMPRTVLLPGLAADERMYAGVREAVGQQCAPLALKLEIPRLLVPEAGEDMVAYARRSAMALNIQSGDIVGGCSFGSMVASAIAAHQQVRALILLSGAFDSSTLRHSGRMLNRIAPAIPFKWLQHILSSDCFLRSVFGAADQENIELGRTMLMDTPEPTLRYGGMLASSATLDKPVEAPVYALHGTEDRVLRPPPVENCTLIPNAGHGMVVSHAQEVAKFLCETLEDVEHGGNQR
ncbi:MAG: alpha/beta fold hydrolase [Thermodesulfobacteriota bacterium]